MIDIDKLTEDELAALGSRISERRAALSTAKAKVDAETQGFDLDNIKPNMSQQAHDAAVDAISRALGRGR